MEPLLPVFWQNQVDMDALCKIPICSRNDRFYYETNPGFRQSIYSTSSNSPHTSTHVHPAVEFYYVIEGVLTVEIAKDRFVIRENQMAAFSSFVQHGLYSETKVRGRLLIIPPQFLPGLRKQLHDKAFANPICTDDSEHTLLKQLLMIDNIHRNRGIFQQTTPELQQTMILPMLQVFTQTVISLCGLKDSIRTSPLIVSALDYIHAHYRQNILVPEMARELFCHQRAISEQFRKAFGISISSYINRLRAIDVYVSLHDNPALTLEEASAHAGFRSMRSMLRAYRSEYGTTPSNNR